MWKPELGATLLLFSAVSWICVNLEVNQMPKHYTKKTYRTVGKVPKLWLDAHLMEGWVVTTASMIWMTNRMRQPGNSMKMEILWTFTTIVVYF